MKKKMPLALSLIPAILLALCFISRFTGIAHNLRVGAPIHGLLLSLLPNLILWLLLGIALVRGRKDMVGGILLALCALVPVYLLLRTRNLIMIVFLVVKILVFVGMALLCFDVIKVKHKVIGIAMAVATAVAFIPYLILTIPMYAPLLKMPGDGFYGFRHFTAWAGNVFRNFLPIILENVALILAALAVGMDRKVKVAPQGQYDQAPYRFAPQAQQYQQVPQYQAPQYQQPVYTQPQQVPQYQQPVYAQPQYQAPQYQAPQYQQVPQYQQPQYQAPQYQAPQYQAPQYQQVPQYQQPIYAQPQYQPAPQEAAIPQAPVAPQEEQL